MNKLIEILKVLAKQYPLEEYFTWDIPTNCPIVIPKEYQSVLDRNIYLKHHLYSSISNKQLQNRYWIIQDWGGIRSLKQNERNDLLLFKLDSELEKQSLTRQTFAVISSLSKVASFIDHQEYAIYDSRVIYALNWLLFKHTKTTEFFPQPAGRNADLIKFELNTIFNLSDREIHYTSHKKAYHCFCELLKELSLAVYNKSEPYWIEMLLFIIAPTYIVQDIQSSLKLSFR